MSEPSYRDGLGEYLITYDDGRIQFVWAHGPLDALRKRRDRAVKVETWRNGGWVELNGVL